MISRALPALVAVVAVGLSGCSGDATPDDDPAPTRATTDTASGSTEPGGTAEPTAAASPTVTPAAGHLIDRGVFSYHLPEEVEWDLDRNGLSANYNDEDFNDWRIVESDTTAQAGSPRTVDYAARLSLRNTTGYDPPLERGDNRVVNGVEGFTAQTVDETFGELVYVYGTYHDGRFIDLTFVGPDKHPQTRKWIEAVLASVEWK